SVLISHPLSFKVGLLVNPFYVYDYGVYVRAPIVVKPRTTPQFLISRSTREAVWFIAVSLFSLLLDGVGYVRAAIPFSMF
ncbi:MAG TPA: hypothetical protein VK638_06585, partial [Edaphobacter sp.]|nr:hypothetical protein [Edaphobacter sp.]